MGKPSTLDFVRCVAEAIESPHATDESHLQRVADLLADDEGDLGSFVDAIIERLGQPLPPRIAHVDMRVSLYLQVDVDTREVIRSTVLTPPVDLNPGDDGVGYSWLLNDAPIDDDEIVARLFATVNESEWPNPDLQS